MIRLKNNRKTVITAVLAVCAALAAAVFALWPELLEYDLGAANAQYRHMIPESERSAYSDSFSSDLPVIYASVEDTNLLYPDWQWSADFSTGRLPPRENCASEVFVLNAPASLSCAATQYFPNAVLRLRGRTSSYTQHKLPFKLEIYDESGKSFNQPLLSLGAESDFLLCAPFNDRSLIRNWLAYKLGAEILEYSPACDFAEVIINQRDEKISYDDYKGVYLLVDSLKPSPERINVGNYVYPIAASRWFEEGGGYIVKQDHYEAGFEDAHLLMPTPSGEVFMIVSPKYGELTYSDADAIKAELSFFDDIIAGGTDEQLEYYLDLDSFADMMLLNEFLKNSEGMQYSAYYYRAKGGKFVCGPPWDFDIGTGNMDYSESYANADGFFILALETSERLLAHPVFKELVIERWRELRAGGGAFSEAHIDDMIDYANTLLASASVRNDERYAELFDIEHGFVPFGNSTYYHPSSSLEEREMIREFLTRRGLWLDENIGSL